MGRRMIPGIDLSYANGIVNWNAAAESSDVKFAYTRATYGANPADDDGSSFVHNHDECKRLSIPVGAYHFYRFACDGHAQAAHFLSATDGRLGTLLPMVDVEEQSFDGVPDLTAAVASLADVLHAIELQIGKRAIIYTNWNTWTTYLRDTDAFSGHPLWCAQTIDPRRSGLFGGWKEALLWQDATTTIPGISGAVDRDYLLGAMEDITR